MNLCYFQKSSLGTSLPFPSLNDPTIYRVSPLPCKIILTIHMYDHSSPLHGLLLKNLRYGQVYSTTRVPPNYRSTHELKPILVNTQEIISFLVEKTNIP